MAIYSLSTASLRAANALGGSGYAWWCAFCVYTTISVTLVGFSAALCWWAPVAAGSGIPEVKAYLQGIRVRGALPSECPSSPGGTVMATHDALQVTSLASCSPPAVFRFTVLEGDLLCTTAPMHWGSGFEAQRGPIHRNAPSKTLYC